MSLSETLANAELRTELALRQIAELTRGEHSHDHTKAILREIAKRIAENLDELKRAAAANNADVVRANAATLILDLDIYLPVLGFVLRSSNVRNAFEVFDPLMAMCKNILGPDVRLIYSSEWDYSPFMQSFSSPRLMNVVVVGLPAHESGNALLIPVVGHELGHAKWRKSNILASLKDEISKTILDYVMDNLDDIVGSENAKTYMSQADPRTLVSLMVSEVGEAQDAAELQCEEVFCDVVGTRIFGASYLRAFAYLLFPSPANMERFNFDYPSNSVRIRYMKDAAKHFGTPVSDDFGADFEDTPAKDFRPQLQHVVTAADKATDAAFPNILKAVETHLTTSVIPMIEEGRVKQLEAAFAAKGPGNSDYALPDIIEAAWRTHLIGLEHGERFARLQALNEFVFKTIEVSEFYRRSGS